MLSINHWKFSKSTGLPSTISRSFKMLDTTRSNRYVLHNINDDTYKNCIIYGKIESFFSHTYLYFASNMLCIFRLLTRRFAVFRMSRGFPKPKSPSWRSSSSRWSPWILKQLRMSLKIARVSYAWQQDRSNSINSWRAESKLDLSPKLWVVAKFDGIFFVFLLSYLPWIHSVNTVAIKSLSLIVVLLKILNA